MTREVPNVELVPVEPDAVEWCRTFWRSMADRLRRQAREHEQRAAHHDRTAAGLSVWSARDFPWAHPARTTARLDGVTARAAAAICREGAAFARSVLKEFDQQNGEVWPFFVPPEVLERASCAPERDGVWTSGPRLPLEGMNEIRIADADRMAVRRADLGSPPIYELTDPDHADAPDAGRYSRFFRLDGAGDWPRIIETTEDTRAMLQAAVMRSAAMLNVQRRAMPAAPGFEGRITTEFRRAGPSGDQVRTVAAEDGGIGRPAAEVIQPLQALWPSTIDLGQLRAGEAFAKAFADANYPLGRAAGHLVKVPSAPGPEAGPAAGAEAARREVASMLAALGGAGGLFGSVVWTVAGEGRGVEGWRTSRHHRSGPVAKEEATGLVRAALATLRAHLDAPAIEFNHRRHGLKIRVAGSVELSFLVSSRHFKMACRYDPALKAWIGDRMVPRKHPVPGKAAEFRHWAVRAHNVAELVESSVAAATVYLQTARPATTTAMSTDETGTN
ncbi:hypothetical protein [Azospirillum sp. Sh1]|uniref:hypothetical protein n=1 Tax=Azospirillum sp. Sh1 TaxID=2607285 RepID=UPI0011EDFA86|nr:hypothetical protein [Azospirillum sp. Sh1]KAA0576697.1 hypothetical protein FZ029_12585 [Azospirillum sp. Sh1]